MSTKKKDLVIEEIRASRRRMSLECRHDPDLLVCMVQRLQSRYGKQIRKYGRTHDGAKVALAHSA
jgi:hypothetical protein